jgi:predicted transposase YbfD/YdcC
LLQTIFQLRNAVKELVNKLVSLFESERRLLRLRIVFVHEPYHEAARGSLNRQKGIMGRSSHLGSQYHLAEQLQIVDHGGDYLLAVKGNQETLHRAVREAMAPLAREGSHQATIEQSRGRTELREYHVMPAGEMVKQFPTWKGLNTLGVAIGYRRDSKGNESLEYRYYISSAALTEEQFAKAVRGHWGIENQLHWVLDVTMKEDACPIYRGDAAQILATVRHMALNMLRAEKGKTASIRRKQKIAAMNSDYLEQVILAGITAANKN